MNTFFIEFRDPLISIIIFFVIIFVITFLSYWWGRYRTKEESKTLDKFLQQFRALPSQDELNVLISSGEISQKSWLLLANAYATNGDYEKAIEIYHEILKLPTNSNRQETLFLLGKIYFKAGFLERSKQIFLEILKTSPRTPQALHYLLLVFEYMRDYKSALEVLEPLEELDEEIEHDKTYLRVLSLLNNFSLSDEEKTTDLIKIYADTHQLSYLIFEYIFKINPKLAWQHLDTSKCERLSDILWNLSVNNLDFDIISKNSFLRELYSAKGDIDLAQKSSIFELDALINLKNSSTNATLNFDYICNKCKHNFPFAFHRCSNCHAIDTLEIEWILSKDYHKDFSEENNSFQ